MWLRTLRQWLNKQKHAAQEEQERELRLWREHEELGASKAEQPPWWFMPPPI